MCSPDAFTTWLALFYRHWDIMVFTLAWTIILMQFTSFLSASCAFVSVFDIWDWFRDFECDCKEYFIFSWTIDVKLCNFCLQTWVNAEALVRFHPKRCDEKFEISSLCFKHQMSFHLPRNCQACKSHNEARFRPCSVKVFQLNTMSVPPLVRICGFPLPSLIFFSM